MATSLGRPTRQTARNMWPRIWYSTTPFSSAMTSARAARHSTTRPSAYSGLQSSVMRSSAPLSVTVSMVRRCSSISAWALAMALAASFALLLWLRAEAAAHSPELRRGAVAGVDWLAGLRG